MERHEIREDGRIAEWVDAVERGDEVVFVRDGTVVAEMKAPAPTLRSSAIDLEKLKILHSRLGRLAGGDGAGLVREMRDAGY